jgi:peptidoglycan/xylan/chitin deacetylase (PgdA/CDA1 family)
LATLLCAAGRSDVSAPKTSVVTVLCYHTFDSHKVTPFTVSSQDFEDQMRFLAVQRIPVIPMRQLLDFLDGAATLPPRSVVITIDDGYKSARRKAWPILRRFKYPFTLFVYPQAIGNHGASLTWADLEAMRDAGVDIESHSFTHPLLTHPGHAMGPSEYTDWLRYELKTSRELLEQRLERPVTALAYPYGGYDEAVVRAAAEASYRAAFTCNDG